jgi:hypothetical protein
VSNCGGSADASALDGGMAPSIVDVGRVSGCDASCAFIASAHIDVRTYSSLTLPPLRSLTIKVDGRNGWRLTCGSSKLLPRYSS